jgi:hypothetical protein
MTSDQITGVLRAILAAIGGYFIGKGAISAATFDWLTGGILAIVPILWSMWTNRPAGIAGAAQALPGVNVVTTPAASPAVVSAVNAAK